MNIERGQAVAKIFLEADVPLHLWGAAGAGKSSFMEALIAEMGYHEVDLRLATQEVGDLIGIPYTEERTIEVFTGMSEDGEPIKEERTYSVTCWAAPNWLVGIYEKAAQGIPTVIFADEMDRAPKEVIQCFYQMVTKRMLHEHVLPPGTRIVAAGNPPTEEYMVDTFDVAMLTRWGHIVIDADPQTWLEQFGPKCHGDVSGFIATEPDALMRKTKSWEVDQVQMPTPRGWEFVDRIYRVAHDKDRHLLQLCVGAVVGRAAATSFMVSLDKDWIRVDDLLSGRAGMEDIKKHPEGNLQLIRLSHEIMHSMTMDNFKVGSNGDKSIVELRKDRFCKFMVDLCKEKKELVIGACKVLGHRCPDLMRLLLVRDKEIGVVTKALSNNIRKMF